jgi:hypothetical protein
MRSRRGWGLRQNVGEFAGAVSEVISIYTESMEHGEKEIRDSGLLFVIPQVPAMAKTEAASTGKEKGIVVIIVSTTIAGAIKNQCAVEDTSVSFLRIGQ